MKAESVGAVIIDPKSKQVLLIKRRDVPIWVLPGGGVEEGESSEEALLREVEEETGLRIEIVRQVAHYLPPNGLARHTALYECRPLSGAPRCGDECAEIGFFDCEAFPAPFLPTHRHWVEDTFLGAPQLIVKEVEAIGYKEIFLYIFTHPILSFRYLLARLGMPLNS